MNVSLKQFGYCLLAAIAVVISLSSVARAGLDIVEAQPIDSWSGTPTIEAGPLSNDVAEAVSTKYLRAQTFTVAEAGVLDKVDIVYVTRNYGAEFDTVTVQLRELGMNLGGADTYADTVPNLLTDGLTFSLTEASDTGGANTTLGGSTKVITLDFTGDDEAALEAGKTYSLELFGADGSFMVQRGSAWDDPYADGKYFLCTDPAYPWDNEFGDRGSYAVTFDPARPGSDLGMAFYLTAAGPAVLTGDANNDGVVSADDFAAVQTNFGNTGTADGLLPGDANDDGVVSADDFAAIQTNFGNVLGSTTEATPIPEPATFSLFAIGALAVRRRR